MAHQTPAARGKRRHRTARLLIAVASLSAPAFAAAEPPVPAPLLRPGAWVHIQGDSEPAGTLSPRVVLLRAPQSKPLLRGRITAAENGGRRLILLNLAILTDPGTTIYRGQARRPASLSEVVPGVLVEAKVVRRGKRIVATRIRIEDSGPEDRIASIEAPVERIDAAGGLVFLLGTPVALTAQTQILDERRGGGAADIPANTLKRDDDDQQVRPLTIGDTLTIGGRIETTLLDRSNFDLASARPDRNERLESRQQLLASAAFTPTFEAYAKVTTARRFPLLDGAGTARRTGDIRVEEAYLTIHEPAGLRLTAHVGRQRFRDGREWFFDEYLDAVRVRTEVSRWSIDVALARGLFRPELDDREPRDAQHLITSAATRVGNATVNAFFLARRDPVSDQAPSWIGATVSGRFAPRLKYWSQAALQRGRVRDVRLRGWAADVGTTWELPVRYRPSLTLGFATGSGDDNRGDGVDTAFHQTELHDNKARFAGLKRFAYYGEALRPELSDVSIVTVGATAVPRPRWSVDLVYHRYMRRGSAPWRADIDIKSLADGGERHLGDEVDAVVASQAIRGIDLSLIVGVFRPGPAFPRGQSPAVVFRPQMRFYF